MLAYPNLKGLKRDKIEQRERESARYRESVEKKCNSVCLSNALRSETDRTQVIPNPIKSRILNGKRSGTISASTKKKTAPRLDYARVLSLWEFVWFTTLMCLCLFNKSFDVFAPRFGFFSSSFHWTDRTFASKPLYTSKFQPIPNTTRHLGITMMTVDALYSGH